MREDPFSKSKRHLRGLARTTKALLGRTRRDLARFGEPSGHPAHACAYPYAEQLSQVRSRLSLLAQPVHTGVERADYLELCAGIVDHFTDHQAETGAIVDPYALIEKQYATPCYALAAAYLVKSGRRPDLERSAAAALDHSLRALVTMRAADAHGDFFTFPSVLAYEALRDAVAPERARVWKRLLCQLRPSRCYTDIYQPRRQALYNWNAIALSGEFLRHRLGLAGVEFVEYYLRDQLRRFTAAGMYLDAGEPMIYDHFPRYFLAFMLHFGYRGEHRLALTELLDRGECTSLLLQSPLGEMPTGGRSKQHQWGDAMQCATFELWASWKRDQGDLVLAGAFKRAAHLALGALRPWVRPSGDLWIVKNRHDPSERHGFESYSWHSTYNLLTASMLAMAWQVADDSIVEGSTPAEVGGFAIQVPEFHKVFANQRGHYLQIETRARRVYDSTGLVRIHQLGFLPQLGPSDAGPAVEGEAWWDGEQWNETLARGSQARPSSLGVSWWDGRRWASLDDPEGGSAYTSLLTVLEQTEAELHFEVTYTSGRSNGVVLREHYVLTAKTVTVSIEVTGNVERLRLCLPVLISDGQHEHAVDIQVGSVRVGWAGQWREFCLIRPEGILPTRVEERIPCRNGVLTRVLAEIHGSSVTYRISSIAPALS